MQEPENPYQPSLSSNGLPPKTPPSNRPLSFAYGITLLVVSFVTCAFGLGGISFFAFQIKDASVPWWMIGGILAPVIWNAIIAFGAIAILRRGSLLAARITTALAMFPLLGPLYIVGFFVGIWGFVVLSREEVIESFNATSVATSQSSQVA